MRIPQMTGVQWADGAPHVDAAYRVWIADVVVSEWGPIAWMSAFTGCWHAALHALVCSGPMLSKKGST